MRNDHLYAEILEMMREQGRKDNPVTLQLGVMQSSNSVKIDDLVLNSEDLYIADYLMEGYPRKITVPYVSDARAICHNGNYDTYAVDIDLTKQETMTYAEGLKKGDLVAVQKLNDNNKYVILARVVSA